MIEVRKDLCSSYGQIPLLKQGHLRSIAQDHAQMASAYL